MEEDNSKYELSITLTDGQVLEYEGFNAEDALEQFKNGVPFIQTDGIVENGYFHSFINREQISSLRYTHTII